VLHRVVGHLLLEAGFILLEHRADLSQSDFLTVEIYLEVICARELVGHLILHLHDLLRHLLHFFLNSSL